jgi:hypothetical protein
VELFFILHFRSSRRSILDSLKENLQVALSMIFLIYIDSNFVLLTPLTPSLLSRKEFRARKSLQQHMLRIPKVIRGCEG